MMLTRRDVTVAILCIGLTASVCLTVLRFRKFSPTSPLPDKKSAWQDHISIISAAEFWRQLESNRLLPQHEFKSLWREMPELRNTEPIDDQIVIQALLELDTSDEALENGPHVEFVDYDGSHILGDVLIQSIYAFQNLQLDVWLLRQKTYSATKWGLFALVQDKSIEPNLVRFVRFGNGTPTLVSRDCFQCHPNGPRAIHAARPDLISGSKYAVEINRYCEEQQRINTRFVEGEAEFTQALRAAECAECHSGKAQRGPLYRIHATAIRSLIARGLMPPRSRLSRQGSIEIERWLGESEQPWPVTDMLIDKPQGINP